MKNRPLSRRKAQWKLKFPIIGEVVDVNGELWDVRDVRPTKYGFDLYYGTPNKDHGAYKGGLPRLIASKGLRDFWETNRERGYGMLFDLPAGRTTLKRVRKRLGFHWPNDWHKFWQARAADLERMPPREFAAKHDVTVDLAFDWRQKIIGIRARPLGWWRTDQTCRLLLSGRTLKEIGKELGISTSQVHRLRLRAQREFEGELKAA